MRAETVFPAIAASMPFETSALAHAHRAGLNAIELDSLSQVITRLGRDHSTVAPAALHSELSEFEKLQYIEIRETDAGTLELSLSAPGALLSNYFWAVWVPKYLFSCSLKVGVIPALSGQAEAHHCTVVFRIPGAREAAREFLTDLATRYPGDSPEIVAIQAGDALNQEVAP